MKAIFTHNLAKKYWFYEKKPGFIGSLKNLFSGQKIFVEAVRGINLEADIGEIIGFIGPNGAGKTTTLKMLSGILYPTSGEVRVMGFVPYNREKKFLKQITFLSGQRSHLFWDLPAIEYFNFCRVVYDIPENIFRENLKRLTRLAEIEEILHIPQRKLSFGQRKRCELVAALLHDPKVIFLDEPTNALDLINARKIRAFIKEKAKEGNCTVILTSHNIADIEQVCERVVIINMGKIVYDGKINDLSRLNGFKRKIRILFRNDWNIEAIKMLGNLIRSEGQEALLEVPTEKATQVASTIMSQFPVQDIRIEDPSLETIIEYIYQKKDE